MEDTQVDRLIEALSQIRVIPIERDMWDGAAIAAYMKFGTRHVMERIVCLPKFPQAIRLSLPNGGKSQPRWKAIEVMAWFESFQESREA